MEINTNSTPINLSNTQIRLTAHKARLANKEELNDSLKSLHEDFKPISNEDALKYLQSKSNISQAQSNGIAYGDFGENISSLSKQLNSINDSIAKYTANGSSSDEKADATKKEELTVGSTDIKLEEADYNKDTNTRSYISEEATVAVGDYKIEDFKLDVKLDEENNQVLEAEAKIELSSQEFELTLAQTYDDEKVFMFEEDAKIQVSDNVTLEKLILSDSSLHYTAQTTAREEIKTNDEQVIQTLQSLEKQNGAFTTGTTDSLVAQAKENKTTILEEFKNLIDQQEDQEPLKQDILQLRIDSIQNQEKSTQDVTSILLGII